MSVDWLTPSFDRADYGFWPDAQGIEIAILHPREFAAWYAQQSWESVDNHDSRWRDLAERAAKAANAGELLRGMAVDLGENHPFYVDCSDAFWHHTERQTAPLGSAVGMPETDEFLRSFEWRRVRMMVLERDGARCACCGKTAADGVAIHVDHIKPRKRRPDLALDPANLQVLCEECNHGKGNRFATDWRPEAR